MTCTVPQLRELLEGEGLRYYLIPDRDGVMVQMRGNEGEYQFNILLELDWEFLQFRSIGYAHCPQGHPNLDVTLQVLGEANYRLRLMKFGWDPIDGEIAAYADLWIADAEITQGQFSRMANGFMSILDDEFPKIQKAIESGIGPQGAGDGSEDEETIAAL